MFRQLVFAADISQGTKTKINKPPTSVREQNENKQNFAKLSRNKQVKSIHDRQDHDRQD